MPTTDLLPAAPSPPEIAGRFVLLRRIGSGGSGTVWQSWDRRRAAPAAVKVLDDADRAALVRFVHEQAVRLDHPHLVTPYAWAAEDEAVALATELVRGGSLAELYADHGALPVGYVAALLDQLLGALTVIHDAGLVHRDLKPANLLLEPTGTGWPHLRVGDFGVAGSHADPRQLPGVVGTDGYQAPEQADGAPPHPAQDVYAAAQVVLRVLAEVPEAAGARPARVPGPFAALLRAMAGTDPAARPDTEQCRVWLRELGIRLRDGDRAGAVSTEPTAAPPDVPDRLGELPAPGAPRGERVLPAQRRPRPWWTGRRS